MTEDAKKVWEVMEKDFGWSNQPKDFHLEYFEDIVRATKQALRTHNVVGRSELLLAFFNHIQRQYNIEADITFGEALQSFESK